MSTDDLRAAMQADRKFTEGDLDSEYMRGYKEGWASEHETSEKYRERLKAIRDYTEPNFMPDDGGPWLLTVHVMARAALEAE